MSQRLARWHALGSWIGDRLAILAPICVAVGVLLPQVFGPVNTYAVPFLFACMTFQGSLGNTFSQVLDEFRHPLPMFAVLFVSAVVLPVLAWLAGGALFADQPLVVTGIVLEYCVPVAVITFMWVGMYNGNSSLALATIMVATVLAPVSIPFTLQLLMGAVVHVDAAGMMLSMVEMVGAPALAGMLVNQASRGWGARTLSPNIAPLIKLFVLVIITSNATGLAPYVLHPSLLLVQIGAFVLVFTVFTYAIGVGVARLLRRGRADTVTIGYACGLRNISAGAVIAGQYFPGTPVIVPAMVGTLLQQILAAGFGAIVRRFDRHAAQR